MLARARRFGEARALAGLEARDAECRSWSAWRYGPGCEVFRKFGPRRSRHFLAALPSRHQQTDDGAEGVGGLACDSPDGCSFFIDSTRSRLLMVVGMGSSANGLLRTVPRAQGEPL